jgi:hypothetical protein
MKAVLHGLLEESTDGRVVIDILQRELLSNRYTTSAAFA